MVEIICHGCRTIGSVNRVTAGLRCSCGSTDLDLHEPGEESFFEYMGVKLASPQEPSGGTGFDEPRPDALKGWAQYPGPMPGPNPNSNGEPATPTCPVCKGSGEDIRDNRNDGVCRECGGTGHLTPTTTPAEPQVAPSANPNRTSVPFFGSKIDASCPTCRTASTELVADRREHAWWRCASCGPLADLDVNPWLNPYAELVGFHRQPGFKAHGTRGLRKVKTDGQILKMFAAVREQNPGLTDREALGLVRRTVAKYQKG